MAAPVAPLAADLIEVIRGGLAGLPRIEVGDIGSVLRPALRTALTSGNLDGYNYSKTDGTGTAAQPQYMFWKDGVEWIRATLTWGTVGGEAGNVTVALCEYSGDSGGAWTPLGTVTIAYDADSYVVSATWS